MLTYKTSEDFEKMARAGKVVSNIHYEIYNLTKPGMTLKDLDDIAKNNFEYDPNDLEFLKPTETKTDSNISNSIKHFNN